MRIQRHDQIIGLRIRHDLEQHIEKAEQRIGIYPILAQRGDGVKCAVHQRITVDQYQSIHTSNKPPECIT